MADLTQFLGLNATTSINSFHIYNTDVAGVLNGGRCCAITVPNATTRVHIEMWGGGGGGSGACCCQWAYGMSNPGQYTTRTVSVSGGDTLTICAAGSTCCSPNCKGQDGYPSFVLNNGTTVACVLGGCGGCALCFYKGFNCTGVCVPANLRGGAICGDIGICTYQGMSVAHNFCASDLWEALSGSPKVAQNLRIGGTHCAYSFTRTGCCKNANHWPGGGGNGGGSCGGGCCWGGWGAGGLVILTFHG